MNYDMNLIKYRKSGFFRIAAAILMICFTLFGLTACADTTDSKDNNDDNALIQGTWEIDPMLPSTAPTMSWSSTERVSRTEPPPARMARRSTKK